MALITACNSSPNAGTETTHLSPVVTATDTAGLAQFQAWKAQHELAPVTAYTTQPAAVVPVQKRASAPARNTTRTAPAPAANNTMSSESANTAKAPQKRGWSKAAKGTAIGAGTGAVLGAVINKKNRVVGGVVGGVAGGAVGYGIGRTMDKRDGRY